MRRSYSLSLPHLPQFQMGQVHSPRLPPLRHLRHSQPLPARLSKRQVEGEIYVVQSGDILSTIAEKFGTTVDAIMAANGLNNPDFVFVGQTLRLPADVSANESNGANPENSTPTPTSISRYECPDHGHRGRRQCGCRKRPYRQRRSISPQPTRVDRGHHRRADLSVQRSPPLPGQQRSPA